MSQDLPLFTGEGRPLLLIHDLFSDQDIWSEQIGTLQTVMRICNFALAGHRGAPDFGQPPPASYMDANQARLSPIVAAESGLTIMAHGHACRFALDLAAHFPENVEQLVLFSPILEPHSLFRSLPRFLPFFYECFFVVADTLGEKGPSLKRPFARMASLPGNAARQWVDEWRALAPVDFGQVRARTLILAGDRLPRLPDPPVSEINENLPNSHLIRYAGLGHSLFKESPSTINPILMDFILRPDGFLQKGVESLVGFIKGLFGR